ncbi:MAG: Rpp14/Pop5 family protein [Candidatus Micrarchaeota archaeon]|nr:Rpp14/Pop5 family protein [Candidatus Micrarchaeota archaeon]MDE1847459.1 Rpp14/Pop5 family protein [Candidatus Micrarchaeota archaeon]MDE1864046.1 Rpp14/Pop5 family protein [Candidatus Micrarchaeota archaeon]
MIFRRKSRYVLIEPSRQIDMSQKESWSALREELAKFMGEKSYIDANPFLIEGSSAGNFIIRVSRGSERQLILALSFIKCIGPAEIGFYTIKTSGTIRSLRVKGKKL